MKKLLCLFTCCLLLNVSCRAQGPTNNDERAVAAAVESLKKAMVDGNRQALDRIAAPELTYGHSSGKIEDKAAFVEAIAGGKSDFVTIDLTEQTIKLVGNTALVRHKLTGTTNDGGTPGAVNLGVFTVWQKQQGQWKLLGRQAYKL